MTDVRCRVATIDDVEAIAALHADSWRRNYRGAYLDSYLDGDVLP
ncbi:MAG: GNAT family N-acetyltransferase, partial [Acidimicrobiia bacterium]|nr:GNAT family N-acetyltransferase [Acidimicrobiia bacterium]